MDQFLKQKLWQNEGLWETAKGGLLVKSAIIKHLRELGHNEKSIISLERCGLPSTDYKMVASCDCGTFEFQPKHRCNNRFCPKCVKIRKRRLREHYMKLISQYHNTRKWNFKFLTLNPVNYENLQEGIFQVKKMFKRFIRRDWFTQRVKGGIYALEVTRSEKKTWNVHIHALVYSRDLDNRIRGHCLECGQNYVKQDYVSGKMYCANRGCNSTNVVFKEDSNLVREFKSSAKVEVYCNVKKAKGTETRRLNYILQYIGSDKSGLSDEKEAAMIIKSIYKSRSISVFGEFHDKDLAKNNGCYCDHCKKKVVFERLPNFEEKEKMSIKNYFLEVS